jgi:hypothetical protein
MRPTLLRFIPALLVICTVPAGVARSGENLVDDPSFEMTKEKDRWGFVFQKWVGWIFEGSCEYRVSNLAHSGKHSLLMVGGGEAKIRAWPTKLTLEPGRYRITAYLRGLDIGSGPWGETTEFMFAGKYIPLKKNGTFGWSKLTYVGEVTKRGGPPHPAFGLLAPGYLWVDDVRVEKVDDDLPLTPRPILDEEEKPIEPPDELGAKTVRCPECAYRNNPGHEHCYACGSPLETKKAAATGPAVKRITSFEERSPFEGGKVVHEHATDAEHALRIDRGYVSMDAAENWTGYSYLKVDVYADAKGPLSVDVEVHDRLTRDYWTRVNYSTVVPPGASTLIIPTALYVGEKSRPGRSLLLDGITRLVFSIGDNPQGTLFLDNIRLERDTEPARVQFPGLWAFDVGPGGSPLMEGFTPLDESKVYSKGRGYGWKNAHFWRAFNALQPDPLYQDFICVEKGGLAIDVPNGSYHVFVNMDSPGGFWGEPQVYRRRALVLEGEAHEDSMDMESFKERYFRFWDKEDLPSENTFDKYQVPYFREKHYEVEVNDGQLNIDFQGENWACCVSAIIVFPSEKAAEGKRFLDFVKQRRRFHFDNAFKRILPAPGGEAPQPSAADKERGFIAFRRDWMQDVPCNDRPRPGEAVESLTASAFAGELEPATVSLLPLRELGQVTLSVSDLQGPEDKAIPSSAVHVGYVQHRITRVTGEGSVYTISPKLILPRSAAPVPAGLTRTFWLTVKVPADAGAGVYRGKVRLESEKGGSLSLPLEVKVRKGTLDAVDVPAGPWGHTIDLPWEGREAAEWNRDLAVKSLRKLREYGFTTATGLPVIHYKGFQRGRPQIDFTRADAQMQMFRDNGFRMPVVNYCTFAGIPLYSRNEDVMREADFSDYSEFVKAVFSAIQEHAEEAEWLPVYWNLADEPLGDDLASSAANAKAYRKAFPKGPPYFTGASSFKGSDRSNPHFRLSRALHVANWNEHDEAAVNLQHQAGSDWAFYNGGNRWTYGVYMYKAAKQFDMKFRVSWHWNASAGDPFYALDCREDDYAWCGASPEGELLPAVHFERLREGLDDYRRILTLARLARERAGTEAAKEGEKLIADILCGFKLGDRELKGQESFTKLRARLDAAIEKLR